MQKTAYHYISAGQQTHRLLPELLLETHKLITMNQGETKICAKCKSEFLITAQEKIFYEKKSLPYPAHCLKCRRARRKSLRNAQKLFSRVCAKCGKSLLSTYPPDSPYVIYCEECYYGNVG